MHRAVTRVLQIGFALRLAIDGEALLPVVGFGNWDFIIFVALSLFSRLYVMR